MPHVVEEVVEPRIWEGVVEAIRLVSQKRSHQRIVEQKVPFCVPQFVEEPVERSQITSKERISERVHELIGCPGASHFGRHRRGAGAAGLRGAHLSTFPCHRS